MSGTGENILMAHIDALIKNVERVTNAVISEKIEEKYRNPVHGKFRTKLSELSNALEELQNKFEEKKLIEIGAWREYAIIYKNAQKVFSQFLDFLGGIAVRNMNLEEGICSLAEKLVQENVSLTGITWGSVMILGEERMFDEVAQATQIIRIRFPEWDIWSLPIIAHEYAHLIANLSQEFPELNEMETDAGRETQLAIIKEDMSDKELAELAVNIRIMRQEYQNAAKPAEINEFFEKLEKEKRLGLMLLVVKDYLTTNEERDMSADFLEIRKKFQDTPIAQALKEFSAQQRTHLRRLFADVIATYFLGPAYVFAQLYLRLNPLEINQGFLHKPSSAQRMAFMRGTLAEMNEAGPLVSGPYSELLKQMDELWIKSVQAVDPAYQEGFHFGKPYDQWFPDLYKIMKKKFRNVGFKRGHWDQAMKIANNLLDSPTVDQKTALSIILNAAWCCRFLHPDRLEDIEKKARELCKQAPGAPEREERASSTERQIPGQ